MAFRFLISALALPLRSLAIREVGQQSSVNDEESVSTLQVQHDVLTNFSNADCMHFYIRDCGMHHTEAPSQIEDMRHAFLQCCTEKANYNHDVCQPFMEQIFDGHKQPSASLCSKLSMARKEHHRFGQLLQRRGQLAANRTAVTSVELEQTVGRKLGFASKQQDFVCADDWERRLSRATQTKNVDGCMHKCSFDPECEAISYSDKTCVMCGTATMAYRQGWDTYVKQGTTRESQELCKENRDCDYPQCNAAGWEFQCDQNGKCVNRNLESKLCEHHADDEMPVPGHWCLKQHLYRVCPLRPDDGTN